MDKELKECLYCNTPFIPYKDAARYCTKECGKKYRYKKYSEEGTLTKYQYKNYAKRVYKLDIEDINLLLEKQNYSCSICGIFQELLTDKRKKLFIDHDHKTGKVRGLLCGPCNTMLGMSRDNIETLARAIVYLESNK